MKFELEESLRGATNEVLLEDLRAAAKAMATDTISIAQYEQIGKAHPATIRRRFGSWNNALELAGLRADRSNRKITDEELFDNIKSIWVRLGRQPTSGELKAPDSDFAYFTYKRRFGSWSRSLSAFVIWVNSDAPNHAQEDAQAVSSAVDSTIPPPVTKRRTRREISDRQRFRILVRDGFRCKSCGKSPLVQPGIELHVDHILPWSKGGETIDDNLESKCKQCNLGKGNAFSV